MTNLLALPSETVLVGDYKIRRVLGAGGFGITYLAEEIALNRRVTIKEYFPADFAARIDDVEAVPRSKNCAADYQWGLDRFIEEAQTLARFEHPNIVRVFRYFRENKTGYMVLQWEEGQSLRNWQKALGRAPRQAELDQIIEPLLGALEVIHKSDYLHRDIAPDNIIIRKDRSPVLIDFGSARGEIAHQSRTVSALVKAGYSPYEQYASTTSNQGPWTDIYALGATLYQCVTGKRPPDAPARIVKDEYVPARDAAVGAYRPGFLAAIDKALRLDHKERPQSVLEWRGPLLAPVEKPAAGKIRATLGLGLKKRADAPAELPAAVATEVPPPPDVPQAQGQLLDFIDGLKKPADAAAPTPAAAMPAKAAAATATRQAETAAGDGSPARLAPAHARHGLGYGPVPMTGLASPARAAEPMRPRETAVAQPPAQPAKARADAPARAPETVAAPVPLPVRKRRGSLASRALFFLRPPWRGLLFKLGVGAGVASLAVAYQNQSVPQPSGPAAPRAGVLKPTGTTTAAVPPPPAALARAEPKPVALLQSHRGAVLTVGLMQAGRRIVSVGVDQQVRISDVETGTLSRIFPLTSAAAPLPVQAGTTPAGAPAVAPIVASSPLTAATLQGGQLVTAHADGTVAVWDLERGERVAATRRLDGTISAVGFVADLDRVVAAGPDGKVMLLDRRQATAPLVAADGHRDAVTAIAWVGDRNGLLTAGADRTVRYWGADQLGKRRTYAGHKDTVTALDVAPDARAFGSGAEDGQVRIWSMLSNATRKTIRAHDGRVTALAFSADGSQIATGGSDGLLKLWDVKSGKEIGQVSGRAGALRAIAFTADGRRIVAAGDDGSVKLWEVASLRPSRGE